jgi:dTDP-4-dehydrorhamnose reductase
LTPLRRVLVTGANGQVGRSLLATTPSGADVRGAAQSDLDIGDAAQVERYLGEFQPDIVVNAAAYTAVDRAETEAAQAHRVNADGPLNVARAVSKIDNARLIHISTDFVFDGRASSPYQPDSPTAPLGVYGASKLAGEQAVLATLGSRATVVRTAWVYAAAGQNFLRTMLRLMKERGAVRVVADQIGTPTAAVSLADALWKFAGRPDVCGLYHWTDAGVASWYDFAVAIADEAAAVDLLPQGVTVTPIATADYPTPAKRPAYSVLDTRATLAALNIAPVHWRIKLRSVIQELSVA